MNSSDIEKASLERRRHSVYESLKPISYPDLEHVAGKWLALADPGAVKLLVACMVANHLPTDPVWIFLVAESGGGKTELLQALQAIPETWHLSTLTENTFISGFNPGKKGTPPSLLLEIGEQPATLVLKDFTSVLEMDFRQQAELFSQFREIYDGYTAKRFGTGQSVSWKGKLGILSGSTPVIEQRMRTKGALGERFLNYRVLQPSRADVKRRIAANAGHEEQMRDELRDAFAACFKSIEIPKSLPRLPEAVVTRLEALADVVAFMRTVIFRDNSMQRNIEYIAPPEQSSRVFKQLYALMCSLFIIDGTKPDTEVNLAIVAKTAESSVHSVNVSIMKYLLRYATAAKTATVAVALGYPTASILRYLQDLAAAKVLKRISQGKNKPDLWEVDDDFRVIWNVAFGEVARDQKDSNFEQEEEDYQTYTIPQDDEDPLKAFR